MRLADAWGIGRHSFLSLVQPADETGRQWRVLDASLRHTALILQSIVITVSIPPIKLRLITS
jgi:hypothetical protein